MSRTLHILWAESPDPIPTGDAVLSFLSPKSEERLRLEIGSRLVSAREVSVRFRAEAVKLYTDVSSAIGISFENDQTF